MEIHNWIMETHNCGLFMDLHYWITEIHNWIMDLHNSNYGIIQLWISIIPNYGDPYFPNYY